MGKEASCWPAIEKAEVEGVAFGSVDLPMIDDMQGVALLVATNQLLFKAFLQDRHAALHND